MHPGWRLAPLEYCLTDGVGYKIISSNAEGLEEHIAWLQPETHHCAAQLGWPICAAAVSSG
jgi:hypothetical protein